MTVDNFADIAHRAGWNGDRKVAVLYDFIASRELLAELVTYAMQEADHAEQQEEEPSEPDEDDGVIEFLRGKYSVGLAHSHLGDYLTDHEARYWLAREMDQVQYWPNAWMISDHGNAHLIVLDKAIPVRPDELDKLRERLATGTDVTVTYEHTGDRDTVSGFVDWDYVAMADLDPDERDDTIAVIAGTTGPRFLIHFDNLLAITVTERETS